MKLISLVMLLTFLVSCAHKCPEIKMTYLEQLEKQERVRLKTNIDRSKDLTDIQKFLYFQFVSCARDIVKNPYTVRNLIDWQTDSINNTAAISCLKMVEERHGSIKELLDVLK